MYYFDDGSGNTYSSAPVLCNLRRKRHTHVAVYVLERNANSQFYPNNGSLPWSHNEENSKVVESIYYDNQPHHYLILPRPEDLVVTSKSGIWNFCVVDKM